jgi:Tol biopolymer transport system component
MSDHRWEWTLAWSSDGPQIAFSRSTSSSDFSQDDVWVMNADGSSPTKIVESPTDEWELTWQPT